MSLAGPARGASVWVEPAVRDGLRGAAPFIRIIISDKQKKRKRGGESMSSEHHHNTHHHQQQELEKNAQEFLCKMWRGDGGRANDGSGSPKTSTSGRFLKTEGGEEELGVASNSSGQESEDLLVSKWLANMAGTTGKQAGNYAPLGINTTRPGTPPKIASMKHPHKVGLLIISPYSTFHLGSFVVGI